MTEILSFRTDDETRRIIEEISVFNGVAVSDLLNQVIFDYLIDYREKNKELEIIESLKPIAESLESRKEENILKVKYKNRTKDVRIIRTAFYTIYYTKDINRAIDSLKDALDICYLTPEQRTNIKEFIKALELKDMSEILNTLKDTSSLKRINVSDLVLTIRTLCE